MNMSRPEYVFMEPLKPKDNAPIAPLALILKSTELIRINEIFI